MDARLNKIRMKYYKNDAFTKEVTDDIDYLLVKIDVLQQLAQNGQSAIDTNKRLVRELEIMVDLLVPYVVNQ